ncbi:MAG: hypothetical protein KJ920_13085 [Actinobacteria bacterium]|nr:hypothetical protein [Actinomycetota bacterium]
MSNYEKLGEFGFGFFKSFLKETGEGIRNFFVKYRVGFLPEGMDYSEYQKIKNKTVFKQLKFLIGNHPTLSIILTGLYVSSLDKELKKKIVEENKQRIYNKYKSKGVSIMNMGATGFIEDYVKWLTKYNVEKNPSQQELIDFYEKILEDWQERSIFIQGFMQTLIIISKILGKVNVGKDVFFLFACGNAIKTTEEAISEISINNELKESGYKFLTEKLNNDDNERVWIFEKKED